MVNLGYNINLGWQSNKCNALVLLMNYAQQKNYFIILLNYWANNSHAIF